MLNDINGVIFDMDGTLIDSMWVWSKIDTDFLSKRGFTPPGNLKSEIEHLTFIECAEYFKKNFSIDGTIEDIIEEWNDMAEYEYEHNIKLKPGAEAFLKLLKTLNIKVGIATSNSSYLIEKVLKNNGIYDYFDAITTVDEVNRGKNFPDIYLLAAEKLGSERSVMPRDVIECIPLVLKQ